MLIELSQGLEKDLINLLAQQSFVDAIDNLTLAHYEGKHILLSPHRLTDRLISSSVTSEKTRGILRKVKSQYTDSQNLKKKLTNYIRIDHGIRDIDSENSGHQRCFKVPYAWFSDSEHVQKTRLLCEDDDDCKIYAGVLRAYLVANKINLVEVVFRPSGSGGNSIQDRLRECEYGEGITICIVDSDQKWPGASLGQTAHQLRRTFDRLDRTKTVAHIIILECHELENILPTRLIEEALPDTADRSIIDRLTLANNLRIIGQAKPHWHHDLKEGIKKYDIFFPETPAHKSFILDFVEGQASRHLPKISYCEERPQCKNRSDCACTFFIGFSDILLKKVAFYIEKITPHKLCEIMFSSGQPACGEYWQRISMELLGWGCAYKRMRA